METNMVSGFCKQVSIIMCFSDQNKKQIARHVFILLINLAKMPILQMHPTR